MKMQSYFHDLVEGSCIIASIRILESDYEDAIYDRGELDEVVNMENTYFVKNCLMAIK